MIAGIILAAGASSRMHAPKALLEYRGETFVARLVRVFSQFCDPVTVVLGYHADAIRAAVDAKFVVNPDPDRGQLSSLQTALAGIPEDVDGFLFTPVDCPAVEPETLAALVEAFRRGARIAIPRFDGRRGHPVCVARSLAAEFLALPPASETREIIQRHSSAIEYIGVNDAGILADIDDLAAYRALVE